MEKEQIPWSEMKGKTVKDFRDVGYSNMMLITFEDGTYIAITAIGWPDGSLELHSPYSVNLLELGDIAVELGLISKKYYVELCEQRDQEHKIRAERTKRLMYKRLRKQFKHLDEKIDEVERAKGVK